MKLKPKNLLICSFKFCLNIASEVFAIICSRHIIVENFKGPIWLPGTFILIVKKQGYSCLSLG